MPVKPSLMIFEPEVNGHHPGHLRHLLRYWPATNMRLHFVVSPELALQHQDVMQTACQAPVTWEALTPAELTLYQASKSSLLRRTWMEWQLYRRYAKKIQADQGLIMYLDRFQLPLALGRLLPCQTSGIFFRPKFHYQQPKARPLPGREQLAAWRERWLWRRALRHPQLKTLFCLDPLAVAPLRALGGRSAVVHLPDPIELAPHPPAAVTALRQRLELDPARKVLLLFGLIDRRKGVYQVLKAVEQLPPAQQKQVTLLIVGPFAPVERLAVHTEIARLTRDTAVQLVIQDQFIPEQEIQRYFALADLVLALYQHHVGSSGILLRAAAAGKPVLASDYGLMGRLVAEHRLGIIVDSTQPDVIAANLNIVFSGELAHCFDQQRALCFAQANSAQQFVETIRQQLAS